MGKNSWEWAQNEESPVIQEPLRNKTRGAARTTGSVRSEPRLNEARVEQRAADPAVRKSTGPAAVGKASVSGDAHATEVVMSVGELEPVNSRDPDTRKKRLTLAEALREHGLDETRVAAVYVGLVEKQSRDKEKGAVGVAVGKLLLEVLKEITHVLELRKNAGNSDSSDLPPFVRLIHNVPRPVRTE